MTVKSNVIDFNKHKNSHKVKATHNDIEKIEHEPSPIIDMTKRRDQLADQDRREVTRTVFSQFIGVFIVLPKLGLQPVSIYDISAGGLAFDLPSELGQFNIGEAVTMRIYLSHDTYFSYSAKIANVRAVDHGAVLRHGTILQKDDESYETLTHFMHFLQAVARVAKKDNGDRQMGRVD
ncbi:MAG: PilZ domain-containing protein [Oligoflexia bacterium]|nr:PilZ domain-containing protein [Oligoflexia bacterium]